MWDPEARRTRSSFVEPVTPPTVDPCAAPLVCVQFNQQYLPLVLGACMQLMDPNAWLVADQAALNQVLGRMTDLIANIGTAMPCVSTPPDLGGSSAQRACNIAGYLSNVVIKTAMQQAIDAIQANQTVLGWGRLIIGLIPEAGLVINAAITALSGLYSAMSTGTLTDYEDATASTALFSNITCAIYSAIQTDGMVTDGNFSALVANVAAVSYTHSDVITAIVAYLNALGSNGVGALQSAGALAAYDCSGCGSTGATGPAALPPVQAAGSVTITIAAESTSASNAVLFENLFATAPVVTVGCDNPDFIASTSDPLEGGVTITITAAVPVETDTTATVDWIAMLPRSL